MCLARQLDARSRRLYAAGNLCLFTGIGLMLLEDDFGRHHPHLFLALRFVLICGAIVLLFWSSRRSGGCVAPRERNS
jgi:hypothetical protein